MSSLFKEVCFENNCLQQGFPQVLRTWGLGGGEGGDLFKFDGEA